MRTYKCNAVAIGIAFTAASFSASNPTLAEPSRSREIPATTEAIPLTTTTTTAAPAQSLSLTTTTASPLTREEEDFLNAGDLSHSRYVWGGILGTVVGYGAGHAVQSRYKENGWIFTVGDATFETLGLVTTGICIANVIEKRSCERQRTLSYIAAGGLLTFRIWEIVDLWATPAARHRRYLKLQNKKLQNDSAPSALNLSPALIGEGAFGIAMGFRF